MNSSSMVIVAFLAGLSHLLLVVAHEDQRYDTDPPERIPLYVDTVYPYHNPQESYRYYKFGYCQPKPIHHKVQTLGEVLQGSEKEYSGYDILFRKDDTDRTLCTQSLVQDQIDRFIYAISNHYFYSLYFDEILLKGPMGVTDPDDPNTVYLYTRYNFQFEYNGDRVIDAKVETSSKQQHLLKLTKGMESARVEFTYSVKWRDTNVEFDDRPANNPQEHDEDLVDIQWASIANSSVLVILLTLFLVFIGVRVVNKDYQRYASIDEDDETGWKILHGDVFRPPKYKCLFASIVGTGVQLLLLFIVILTLSVVGVFYQYGRGTMYAAIIIVYSLTAIIAGYTSSTFYHKIEGRNWVHNVLTTCTIFAVPVFIVWSILNSIAWGYGSTVALPFGTIMALFALYCLVTFPLTLAGAIAGKNWHTPLEIPCKPNLIPMEIVPVAWYKGPIPHVLMAGFLPFCATFVELYYVFISLWGHQLLTPYGILYLMFLILLMVTICITISLTYVQLSMLNYQWWWRALVSGGAAAFFVYAYCFYFLYNDSKMTGFMQLSHYFGYMLIICYALFLMLGTVGFAASFFFVRTIYRGIKAE